MIMMFGGLGASLADRSPEWIKEMQSVMMRMDGELRESGEVVDSAVEVASQVVAVTEYPMEIRRIMDESTRM